MKRLSLLLLVATCPTVQAAATPVSPSEKPNIVFILADDWGIGDVKCFGGDLCRIATPHMDKLARNGMRFTDAHSSSSVCTPTRYSLLTGRYNWRSRLKKSVLYGYDKRLIEDGRRTVANLLKDQGYTTGCVGKWHIGMDMPTHDGKPPFSKMTSKDHDKPLDPAKCNLDWEGKIKNGPMAVGFDYFYGISASLDMPPYIWIHNDRFVGTCTTAKAFHRSGPAHKDFFDYDVLPIITTKACEFIAEQAKSETPFFLYVPLNAPHTPISPSQKFRGKSGLGKYADFVMETDWTIGRIADAIDQAGVGENTLLIVTADNGCSPAAASRAGRNTLNLTFNGAQPASPQADRHYASAQYRGHKADIFEGGHRVPFIARWTGRIRADSTCTDPTCLLDLYATCADLLNVPLEDTEAEDSVSMLPNLLGKATSPVREAVVHHSINGSFSIRQSRWKLVFCPDSGGWSAPRPGKDSTAGAPSHQLYDLEKDPGEQTNLYTEDHPAAVTLSTLMKAYIATGRSTPGAPQANNGDTPLYPNVRKK